MFKETDKNPQLDIFSSVTESLTGDSLKRYTNSGAWHNQFRTQVLERIDEKPYQVLFSDGMGAPNASVSLMLGMMILKEAYGWSDEVMYENCRFNLLIRSALGLVNLNDPLPAPSTYYLLRKRMVEHTRTKGIDLMAQTFEAITKGQMDAFNVKAGNLRMDSKLISSNIAFYSRYEIVHRTLVSFLKTTDPATQSKLTGEQRELIASLLPEDAQKTVYHNAKDSIKNRMVQMGLLIVRLLRIYRKHHYHTPAYKILERVFKDQYEMDGPYHVLVLDNEKISPDSVQSPDDPDASYRKKGKQQVKGYSVNVTETISEDKSPDLITQVQVERATVADNVFMAVAIKKTASLTGQQVERVYADGAYQSPENDIKGIDMVYTGIQGKPSQYEYKKLKKNLLQVTDQQTGACFEARPTKPRKGLTSNGWTFINADGKRCTVTHEALRTSLKRQELATRSTEELKKRNNVESSIYCLGQRLNNAKSKYRGLLKQRLWAWSRCLWINLVRIVHFVNVPAPSVG